MTAITGRFRLLVLSLCLALPLPAMASDNRAEVLGTWYRMILELVRHTPTQTPPVASRSFAYTALIAYEATASGSDRLQTLAGQVNGLPPAPPRDPGATYDEDVVLNAALGLAVEVYFANTGPTGQRAKAALAKQLGALTAEGVDADTLARSEAFGIALAQTIIDASATDGGAVIENMGFPMTYTLGGEPQDWVPTNLIQLQQAPASAQLGHKPPPHPARWRGLPPAATPRLFRRPRQPILQRGDGGL